MKYIIVPVLLLVALAPGQWSVPVDVGVDTTMYFAQNFRLVAAGGDTLWAFYETRSRMPAPTYYVIGHWSAGTSWSGPQVLETDSMLYGLAAGVDPLGRVWLSWYHGQYILDIDTWGIYTRIHDALGWQPKRLALSGPSSLMAFPAGQWFAADKHDNWYMGICEEHAPLPDLYHSALYSRFEGDTWIWPRTIAKGVGDPMFLDYGLPSLVARPDTGFWAVYVRLALGEETRLLVDHLVPDTTLPIAQLESCFYYHAETADSSGHLWVVYVDPAGTLRSAAFDTGGSVDRRVIATDCALDEVAICSDPMGWVWACWTRGDTTPVVSYSRGNGWSTPEAVTDMAATAADITSDRDGRIYVAFNAGRLRHQMCYRTSRPGVEERVNGKERREKVAASVIRSLPVGAVAFDAMGRRVLDPKAGVYFVKEGPGTGGQGSGRMRKVVIQR